MMSLEEAIKHCEEVAEEQESKASFNEYRFKTRHIEVYERQWKKYKECASEHRQLAAWLKELEQLRKIYMNGYEEGYKDAKELYS